MRRTAWCLFSACAVLLASCSRGPSLPRLTSADSVAIILDNIEHRGEVDRFFRDDPNSPFKRDSSISFHGIRWFPVNVMYRGQSVLHRYPKADTVIVMGTKGEARRQLRYGYFEFPVPDGDGAETLLHLNVYKFTPYDGQRYALYRDVLSVWFTDLTTNKETYGVGRYVEIGNEDPDQSHIYAIDLNKSYNPYCAYSDKFSCAVPRGEDRLAIALRVGELKYHLDDSTNTH